MLNNALVSANRPVRAPAIREAYEAVSRQCTTPVRIRMMARFGTGRVWALAAAVGKPRFEGVAQGV